MNGDGWFRRPSLAMGLLGLIWLANGAGAAEPAAAFRFGTAEIGARLTNRFLLPNAGSARMEIVRATPSCDGIQVVDWSREVEAGGTGVVEIVFAPDRAGEVDCRVQVWTSSMDRPEREFAIQGLVEAAPSVPSGRDGGLYLGAEEVRRVLADPGSATWVDVRGEEAAGQSRIPGALQMPLYAVKTKPYLKTGKVVLVDEGWGGRQLEAECRELRAAGFADVGIWPGGLNAWRRRGGAVEGSGAAGLDRVPPSALEEIAGAEDWLTVSIGGDVRGLAHAVAVPLDPARPVDFADALRKALEERPQVASVLIIAEDTRDYGLAAEAVAGLDASVFYLEGGWGAWEEQRRFTDAIRRGSNAVAPKSAIDVQRPSRGCSTCPR